MTSPVVDFRGYLLLLRRRLWRVLVPPLVLVLGGAAAVLLPGSQYTATAVIAAPANVGGSGQNQFTGLAGQHNFVSDIEAAVTTPLIVDQVAAATHARRTDIADCLSAQPVGLSSVVDVICTTKRRRIAEPVATAAATATVAFLFAPGRNLASTGLRQAQSELASATAALRTFEAANGPIVDRTYANDLQSVNELQQIANAETATGNVAAAAHTSASLATLQVQMLSLPPKVAEYQLLEANKTEAALNYDHAARDFRQPLLQYIAADPAHTVSASSATRISRTPRLVHLLPTVLLGGLLLGIWLVAYPEHLRQERRGDRLSTVSAAAP